MRIVITNIDHDSKTWNPKFYPTPMRLFYLPMVELGHIPYRPTVREYEGILCILFSYFNYNYFLYNTHSGLAFFLIK